MLNNNIDLSFKPDIIPDNNPNKTINTLFGQATSKIPIDVTKFNDNNITPYAPDTDYIKAMYETRAQDQSTLGLIGKSGVQALTSTLGMTISSVGTLTHPLALISKDRQQNGLEIIGEAIEKTGQDIAPIYQTEKAMSGFAPSDATWWASNAPSVFSSLAIMLPGLGITKGVGAIGSALSKVNNVDKISNLATKTGKLLQTTANSEFGAAVIAGTTGRHIDSWLSSTQTYNELNQQAKDLGMNDYDAQNYASDGARRAYQLGMLNTAFDIAELTILFKGTSFLNRNLKNLKLSEKESAFEFTKKEGDNITKQVLEETIEKPKNWSSYIKNYAKIATLEGIDEMTMDIAQNEAKHYVENKYGINTDESLFGERLSKNLTDEKIINSGFWGALGGIAMTGGSSLINKALFKQHYDTETNRINDFIERNNNLRSKIKIIQDLQEQGLNYEAESIHQSIVNDIVQAGVKNGTIDLDIRTLTNLSKLDFKTLSEDEKTKLIDDGFNENSSNIAKDILHRTLESKKIFDEHLKKDYIEDLDLNDLNLEENNINPEQLKSYLSLVIGTTESNKKSIYDTLIKVTNAHNELNKNVQETLNGKADPKIASHLNNEIDYIANTNNINRLENTLKQDNEAIIFYTNQFNTLKDLAKANPDDKNYNNPLSFEFIKNQINYHEERIKYNTEKLNKYKTTKDNLQEQYDINQINYNNGLENIKIDRANNRIDKINAEIDKQNILIIEENNKNKDNESYTKKDLILHEIKLPRLESQYNTENINELNSSKNHIDYNNKILQSSNLAQQIESLSETHRELYHELEKFKQPEYRKNKIKLIIKEQKEEKDNKIKNLQKTYDNIKKDINNIDAIEDFIKNNDKDIDIKELVIKAKSDLESLKNLKTKKESEQKNKATDEEKNQENSDISKPLENAKKTSPEKGKDILENLSNNLDTKLNDIKITQLNNSIHSDFITTSTNKISYIEDISLFNILEKANKTLTNPRPFLQSEIDANNNLIELDKIIQNTFFINDNIILVKDNISTKQLQENINKINEFKSKYLLEVEKVLQNKQLNEYFSIPYLDINDTATPAYKLYNLLDKINNFIITINENKETNNIILDFKNNPSDAVTQVNKYLDNNFSITDAQSLAHEFNKKYISLLKEQDDNKRISKIDDITKFIKEKIYNTDLDVNFSKTLTNIAFEVNLEIDVDKLNNDIFTVNLIHAQNTLIRAMKLYFNNVIKSKVLKTSHITFHDLAKGIYINDKTYGTNLLNIMVEPLDVALRNTYSNFINPNNVWNIGNNIVPANKLFNIKLTKLVRDNTYLYDSETGEISDKYLKDLKDYLDKIIEDIYVPVTGNYVNLLTPELGREDIHGNTTLYPKGNTENFINFINIINNLNKNSKITLDKKTDTFDSDIDVLVDGIKIGNISKPEFEYDGIKYSKLENGEYIFINPFENLTSEDIELIDEMQDIILDFVKNKNRTQKDLDNLSKGIYINNKTHILYDSPEQKEMLLKLSNISLSFSGGVSLKLSQFRQLYKVLFAGGNTELDKDIIYNRLNNHIDRFRNDFNQTMMIRNNIDNLNIQLESISKPSILYSEDDNLLHNVIKPLDITDTIQLAVINLKDKKDNTLYNPINGSVINFAKIEDTRREEKQSEVLYVILNPSKDVYVPHRLNVASLNDKDITDLEYKRNAEKTVNFVKKEILKLISNPNLTETERKGIINNLRKITIVDYFKGSVITKSGETSDNLTFSILNSFDENSKESNRMRNVNIQNLKDGRFKLTETKYSEKGEYIDKSKDAKANNTLKEEYISYEDIENILDSYVSRMLRNFHYDVTKINLADLNDIIENDNIDTTQNTILYDPLDRYNDDGSLKYKETRKIIKDDGKYGHDYLKYVIESGAVKTNIAAIKHQNGTILSNYNMGYNSTNRLSIHIKATPIIKDNKTLIIDRLKTTDELKELSIFNDYKFLLDEIKEPIKITHDKKSSIDYIAYYNPNNNTINIKNSNAKNIELELAHEVLHKILTDRILKLDKDSKDKLAIDIINIKNRIEEYKNNIDLTEFEKNILINFINEIKFEDSAKANLSTLQELFTYVLTNKDLALVLSKIPAELSNDNIITETIWDKLVKIIKKLINISNKSIIDDINVILNKNLTSLELNIFESLNQSSSIIQSESLKIGKIENDVINDDSSNLNIDNSLIIDDFINDFLLSKNITSMLESDNKILKSNKFNNFKNINQNNSIFDNIEYFKKCK